MSRDPRAFAPPGASASRASEEAADWLICLREDPGNTALAQAHERWLEAAPQNRRAWVVASSGWRLLGAEAAWGRDAAPAARGGRAPRGFLRARARHWAGGMAIAALLALVWVLGPEVLLRARADYISAPGQVSEIALPDGSHVSLAAGSAFRFEPSETRREITLLRGAAFFDVASDAARPFIVTTDRISARAVGTAFEVDRSGGAAQVAVSEGHVRVTGAAPGPELGPTLGPDLGPGDWQRVDTDGDLRRGTVEIGRIAEWRQARLFVEDRPATEVAARLQRQTGGRILLIGRARERRVTGFFDLARPEAALETLAASLNLELRRLGQVHLLYVAD